MNQELQAAKVHIADIETQLSKAEAKLQSERAVLTAFDDELAALERDIKSKKQEVSDTELALQKLGHETAGLTKEETAARGLIRDLENQFTWIRDEKKYVIPHRCNAACILTDPSHTGCSAKLGRNTILLASTLIKLESNVPNWRHNKRRLAEKSTTR
jgi:hypothetical protein